MRRRIRISTSRWRGIAAKSAWSRRRRRKTGTTISKTRERGRRLVSRSGRRTRRSRMRAGMRSLRRRKRRSRSSRWWASWAWARLLLRRVERRGSHRLCPGEGENRRGLGLNRGNRAHLRVRASRRTTMRGLAGISGRRREVIPKGPLDTPSLKTAISTIPLIRIQGLKTSSGYGRRKDAQMKTRRTKPLPLAQGKA